MYLITFEAGQMFVIGKERAARHVRKLYASGFRFVTCDELPEDW